MHKVSIIANRLGIPQIQIGAKTALGAGMPAPCASAMGCLSSLPPQRMSPTGCSRAAKTVGDAASSMG